MILTFLHVFALTVGAFCLFGAGFALWVIGLMKPADALMERGQMNLLICYIFGYIILTVATIAGIIAAVA